VESKNQQGPAVYMNWLASHRGDALLHTCEYPLYSDAHIVGQISCGPYQFLHTLAIPVQGVVQPIMVLRSDWHLDFSFPGFQKTDSTRYHGGSPSEEIAALASLAMGIRLKAGESTREFTPASDPKGSPRAWATRPEPALIVNRAIHRWVLPRAVHGSHSLEALSSCLNILPNMDPCDAVSLVRSARSYQDALWLAESQPELAWLLLVSAVETAANRWRRGKEEPLERLSFSRPDLCDYLSRLGIPDLLPRVATEFAESMGATKKFVDFCLNFRPSEPTERPKFGRIDWSDDSLRRILSIIYGHRSKALHDGCPFPAPMCRAPHSEPSWPSPTEKPLGDSSEAGGTWLEKHIPILFHTFEYIARAALLNWWKSTEKVP
jgi:hypothetical protein